jgi:hypothetical protein
MHRDIKICIKIDNNIIYKFSGKVNEQIMINSANNIEKLLIDNGAKKDKIQNVFELFIETVQNILNYSYKNPLNSSRKEVLCNFSLLYCTKNDTYILESCNLIEKTQQAIIEFKIKSLENLDDKALRKLIRKKSRSKEDSHDNGAGLGYIMMTKKSSLPISIQFSPYEEGILQYKQKLVI